MGETTPRHGPVELAVKTSRVTGDKNPIYPFYQSHLPGEILAFSTAAVSKAGCVHPRGCARQSLGVQEESGFGAIIK